VGKKKTVALDKTARSKRLSPQLKGRREKEATVLFFLPVLEKERGQGKNHRSSSHPSHRVDRDRKKGRERNNNG